MFRLTNPHQTSALIKLTLKFPDPSLKEEVLIEIASDPKESALHFPKDSLSTNQMDTPPYGFKRSTACLASALLGYGPNLSDVATIT